MAFFEEVAAKVSEVTTTATTATGTATSTATATSTTTAVTGSDIIDKPIHNGDANCDGQVDMSDVVLIMQALANPNKYGVGGSDKNAVRQQGWTAADVYEVGSGVTTNDALCIQEFLLGKIKSLPL